MTDTYGVKKIALISGTCLGITTLAFGFSTTFWWALITRFLQGCSIGISVVCKACIAAVCDNTNMAHGMSIIVTSFFAGLVLGPALGGNLNNFSLLSTLLEFVLISLHR